MGWIGPAIIGGTTLLSAIMGSRARRQQAQYSNRPTTTDQTTTTSLQPYNQGVLDNYLSRVMNAFSTTPDVTPYNLQNAYGNIGRYAGRFGGYGNWKPEYGLEYLEKWAPQSIPRPDFESIRPNLDQFMPELEDWRDVWGELREGIRQPYEQKFSQDVLEGKYLDYGSNPYLQDYMDAIARQYGEQTQRSMSDALSPIVAGGGGMQGGTTLAFQQLAAERGAKAMAEHATDFLGQQYQFERQMQHQAQAAEIAIAETLTQAGVSLQQAHQAAQIAVAELGVQGALQMYGIDVNALTNMYNTDVQAATQQHGIAMNFLNSLNQLGLGSAQLGLQGDMFNWNTMMDAAGLAGDLDQALIQQQLLPYDLLSSQGNILLPLLQAFGTQTSHTKGISQGPQVSPSWAAHQGALGGGMWGFGMGRAFSKLFNDWYKNRNTGTTLGTGGSSDYSQGGGTGPATGTL